MFNLMITVVEWSPAVLKISRAMFFFVRLTFMHFYGYPAFDLPPFLCPLTRYLECTFLFASILTQLIVCVERLASVVFIRNSSKVARPTFSYIAIVYPLLVRRLCTRQNILLLAGITWFTALIVSLPYAVVHTKPPTGEQAECCVIICAQNIHFFFLFCFVLF